MLQRQTPCVLLPRPDIWGELRGLLGLELGKTPCLWMVWFGTVDKGSSSTSGVEVCKPDARRDEEGCPAQHAPTAMEWKFLPAVHVARLSLTHSIGPGAHVWKFMDGGCRFANLYLFLAQKTRATKH